MLPRVLVVDDDQGERSDLAEMVTSLGFPVVTAADGREALSRLSAAPVGVILTDLMMPRMDGFELLKELASRGDRTPAIVLTAFGTLAQAVSVVHDLKAFWFLEKPVESAVLRTLLERANQQRSLVEETERLNLQLSHQGVLGDLVGDSPAMKEVFFAIQQVARTTASVLITGESGTGKELVARAIHKLSARSAGPFVAVNCAALPETLMESELFGHEKGAFTGAVERRPGCFEQAQGGTLLLDEIGEEGGPVRPLNRRYADQHPSETASGTGGIQGAEAGGVQRHANLGARSGGHESADRNGHSEQASARGSLLPPQRISPAAAPVARPQG